jgi:uncharacterized protein (DUF433 family)
MIDPAVRGGQPCITGSDVVTGALAERFKAGEGVLDLVGEHGRTQEEIEEAIRYELQAW